MKRRPSRHAATSARVRPGLVSVAVGALASLGVAAAAGAVEVEAVRIDGTKVAGAWVGSRDGRSIELQTAECRELIAVDGLSSLTFRRRVGREAPRSQEPDVKLPGHDSDETKERSGDSASSMSVTAVFYLADGGHLYGELSGPPRQTDAVVTRTALGEAISLAFDRLAGVQLAGREEFPKADGLFRAALSSRLPGQDVLITRNVEDVKTLRGRLEGLDALGGSFVFGEPARDFKTERIFGVVFAAGAGRERHQHHQVTVTLTDGSVFSGRIERADAYSIRIETSLDVTADVPLAAVASVDVHSDRVVYVSDLSVADQRVRGLMHRSWPVRFDQSLSGGSLSISGRVFEKGLGVHSLTELTFEIAGDFETFVATIGIDDSVRPRGSVVFRILGDSKILFDSGSVTGADPPRDIIVDVTGVKTLTLTVDYGDELDLCDHANWGDARLLKAPKPTPAETS
ncbi:MAG: NPCBM/NEW2 domain-containing protein [Phycisphaerales bacterium]|nr:MAG: NPCBM/NEW2 domain-containing protein [Phycisphaerales bacterium]